MTALKPLAARGKGNVAVILPGHRLLDPLRGVRRAVPEEGLPTAGLKASQFTIQNALGSDATQFSDAQTAITKGATVLVVDPLDSGVGAHIESYAKSHGVEVIDYDRLTLGGTRKYYVSFNNVQVGTHDRPGPGQLRRRLEGQDPAGHRHEGRADRQQRDALRPGLRRGAGPQFTSGWKDVSNPAGTWDPPTALSEFQQQYTAHPNINAALIPNDENGAPIIHYLQSKGIKAKTFPTTGQDATLTGLQNILAGYQCGTVYKPIYLEAQAAAALAMYARAGVTPPSRPGQRDHHGHDDQHRGFVGAADAGVGHDRQHELDRHRGQVRAGLPALHAARTPRRARRPGSRAKEWSRMTSRDTSSDE